MFQLSYQKFSIFRISNSYFHFLTQLFDFLTSKNSKVGFFRNLQSSKTFFPGIGHSGVCVRAVPFFRRCRSARVADARAAKWDARASRAAVYGHRCASAPPCARVHAFRRCARPRCTWGSCSAVRIERHQLGRRGAGTAARNRTSVRTMPATRQDQVKTAMRQYIRLDRSRYVYFGEMKRIFSAYKSVLKCILTHFNVYRLRIDL